MTAAAVLAAIRAAGGEVVVTEEQRLKVTAPAPLPTGLMNRLRAAKLDLLALLAAKREAVDDLDIERSAIIEHDAKLARAMSEAVAKRSRPEPVPVVSVAGWMTLYKDWLAYWSAPRKTPHRAAGVASYSKAEAQQLAFAEVELRWHRRHGELVDVGLCAGCLLPLDRSTALHTGDGNEVHHGDDDACLIAYGKRWRAAACKALAGMGLTPPDQDPIP